MRRRKLKIPILAYHYVKDLPSSPTRVERSIIVAPNNFRRQMHLLKDDGFRTVSLFDVWLALKGERGLPGKPVVITFDDCCERQHLQNTLPLLCELGFSATYFVVVDWIAKEHHYSDWQDLSQLTASGMELGCHSFHHLFLTRLTPKALDVEISSSKAVLERKTRAEIRFLSYPFGAFNRRVQTEVQRAGYVGAVTMRRGRGHSLRNIFALKRVPVHGTYGLDTFLSKVR